MTEPRRVILANHQAPGDLLMMTCAIRDLHRLYPGKYITEVKTGLPAVFRNNPYISPPAAKAGKSFKIGYSSSINQSNQRWAHFSTGFVQHLSELLQVRIRLTELKPDLYLTDEEKDPANLPKQLKDVGPYFLMVSGGKDQFTAKIWDHMRWQKVADELKDELTLVQIGKQEKKHAHKPLNGAISMLGKTSFRQLMVLAYHSQGGACCVTALMHLLAAFNKPCVVLDGGREPWWWEAYTAQTWKLNALYEVPEGLSEHRYLHTMGRLDCCKQTACWKAGVGEKGKGNNCKKVEEGDSQPQPACLKLIEPELVVSEIRSMLRGEKPRAEKVPEHLKRPLFNEKLPSKPSRPYARHAPRAAPPGVLDKQAYVASRKRGGRMKPTTGKKARRTANPRGLFEVGEEDYKLYDVAHLLPVTICALWKGDCAMAAQKCLSRVYQSVPANMFELRVGLYGATPAALEWIRRVVVPRGNLKLYEAQKGSGYYPLMRRMIYEPELATPWTAWFEGQAHPVASQWLLKFLVCAHQSDQHLIGRKFFYHFQDGQREWTKKADWYRGAPFDRRKGQEIINYVKRDMWMSSKKLLVDAGWPDHRLKDKSGDIFLGEAANQLGLGVKNFMHGVKG